MRIVLQTDPYPPKRESQSGKICIFEKKKSNAMTPSHPPIGSDMQLYVLGCGSATPTTRHLPSAQILSIKGKLYLIDCGEGTQRSIRQYKLNFNRIEAIFISHLHGDHLFGLPGLLSTMQLLLRTKPITIVGAQGITDYVQHIVRYFLTEKEFEIEIVEKGEGNEEGIVYSDNLIEVRSLRLEHRVPTIGYFFEEKVPPRRINSTAVSFYQIPKVYYPRLQMGWDYITPSGDTIPNAQLTLEGRKARSYAYCSDTLYMPHWSDRISSPTLLFHESTFLEEVGDELCQNTGHSTAKQAAMVAQEVGAERLLIGHYSARWSGTEPFVQEAQSIFAQTIGAQEGLVVDI